jgi:hypothetical protein
MPEKLSMGRRVTGVDWLIPREVISFRVCMIRVVY